METRPTIAPDERKSERAAPSPPVVGFQDMIGGDPTPGRPSGETAPRITPACPICGGPLHGRQTSACSDKCRAARSRQERARKLTERERRVQAYLLTALETLWEAQEAMKGR